MANPDRADKASAKARQDAVHPPKGVLRDYAETIASVLIVVLFARTWVFQNSKIPTSSMEKTLLVGDRLLVNAFVFGPHAFRWEPKVFPLRPIERGDVVVFRYPQEPSVPYIKRVVAKAGDVVELRANRLYVNGLPMREDYVNLPDPVRYGPASPIPAPTDALEYPCFIHEREAFKEQPEPFTSPPLFRPRITDGVPLQGEFGPFTVPVSHLFVMGDNRDNSQDARYFGVLDEGLVVGRAWVVWWSYEEETNSHLRNRPSDHLRRIGDKIVHFFSKTRWDRMFRPAR